MIPPKPSHPERLAPAQPEWEIFQGNAFLYLIGPGPDAMQKCGGSPASDEEMAIAARALALLNIRHRENKDAGNAEIVAVLVECGWEEGA